MAYPFNYQLFQPNYQQSNIVWVQGVEGAKAHPVGAGNTVLMMDSESQTLFIKSADASGVPSLRVFDYTERTGKVEPSPYITREEFEEAIAKLKPAKKKKVEDEDDE